MTDLDHDDETDEPDYDDDWFDPTDDLRPPKEEPDCYSCNDSGFIAPDYRKRCKDCRPTRFELWWWRRTWRIHERLDRARRRRWRKKHPGQVDEPPF